MQVEEHECFAGSRSDPAPILVEDDFEEEQVVKYRHQALIRIMNLK